MQINISWFDLVYVFFIMFIVFMLGYGTGIRIIFNDKNAIEYQEVLINSSDKGLCLARIESNIKPIIIVCQGDVKDERKREGT